MPHAHPLCDIQKKYLQESVRAQEREIKILCTALEKIMRQLNVQTRHPQEKGTPCLASMKEVLTRKYAAQWPDFRPTDQEVFEEETFRWLCSMTAEKDFHLLVALCSPSGLMVPNHLEKAFLDWAGLQLQIKRGLDDDDGEENGSLNETCGGETVHPEMDFTEEITIAEGRCEPVGALLDRYAKPVLSN
jgi:hypothetical protein